MEEKERRHRCIHQMLLPYSILYPVSLFERLTGWKTHFWKSVLFPRGQPLRMLFLAQRLHRNSLIAHGGLQQLFALQFSYHYNQSSRCSKLPNETFLQCDQCHLSKDMKGMNVVVDERLVTWKSKECWIESWMLKKKTIQVPQLLQASAQASFNLPKINSSLQNVLLDSHRLKEQPLRSN